MPVGAAADVEAVRVRELRGIAVCGTDAQVDRSARRDGNAADFRVDYRHAVAELHRRIEAQHLVDGGTHQLGIVEQAATLLGMLQKQVQPVADEIRRRLMPSIQDENAILQQFDFGEPFAVRLAGDEPRQHITLRMPRPFPPACDQRREIGAELVHGSVPLREGLRRDDRFQGAENIERPLPQRPALGVRNVEQIADHLHGDGDRIILDEIDDGLVTHRVEQAVDEADQVRLEVSDDAGRQGPIDEPAHARVQRRIVEDQARRVVFVERRVAELRLELHLLVGAEAHDVLIDALHVGVARKEETVVRQVADRLCFAQIAIGRIRIVVERAR